jgi:hypothetical protein
MPTVVPVQLDESTTIYVEATDAAVIAGSGIQEAASPAEVAERAINTVQDISTSIRSFCERVRLSFQQMDANLRPDKATVEFGLDVSVEGNVYVVKGSAAACITITAEWELGRQAPPQ